jgi:Protein of unknown function (DUF3592)
MLLLMGGLVLAVACRDISRASDTTDWDATRGIVVTSGVEQRRSEGSRPGMTYRARVTYEYNVRKKTYVGERITYIDTWSSNRSLAERVTGRYPEGKSVTVHYQPEAPEKSVLETGVSGGNWFVFSFGLFFFGAGCVMFYFRRSLAGSPKLPQRSYRR